MTRKLWLVAGHEYRREVLTRGFVVAAFVAPLLVVLILGLGFVIETLQESGAPVGYVDSSGWLARAEALSGSETSTMGSNRDRLAFLAFADTADAQAALQVGEIQAYFVLPAGYPEEREVELYYLRSPGDNVTAQFRDMVQLRMLDGYPEDIAQRAVRGSYLTARTPDGVRQFTERAGMGVIAPLILVIILMILFASSSTSLVQSVVREKESRTVEVVVSSISPNDLIGGKVLGIVGMGLTLLALWVALIALEGFVAGRLLQMEWVRYVRLHPKLIGTVALLAIPSYLMYGGLMTAAGATVADAQESQQVGGLLSFAFAIPLWSIVVLMEQPNSPLALFLSIFPLTSLAAMCIRVSFAPVATWQIVAAIASVTLSAMLSIWIAGRAFRLGMLRYGKRLDLRELLGRRSERPSPIRS